MLWDGEVVRCWPLMVVPSFGACLRSRLLQDFHKLLAASRPHLPRCWGLNLMRKTEIIWELFKSGNCADRCGVSYRVVMMLSNVWPETTNVDCSLLKDPVTDSSCKNSGNSTNNLKWEGNVWQWIRRKNFRGLGGECWCAVGIKCHWYEL